MFCVLVSYNNSSLYSNRPRLSRDYKNCDISLNTHTNCFKFKTHITNMYIHTFGKIKVGLCIKRK